MRERLKLGSGYHSEIFTSRLRENVVIKLANPSPLRSRENTQGETAYQRTVFEVGLLEKYFERQYLLRTRVRSGPCGVWWIEQERLPKSHQVVSSETVTDKSDLQAIAKEARIMVKETGFWLDWFGLESLNSERVRRVVDDPNFWILPNLKKIPDENRRDGTIKIVDTGLFSARVSQNNGLIIYPYEPAVYQLQELVLKLVGRRSGIVF